MKRNRIKLICKYCGKEFGVSIWRKDAKFCSKACYTDAQNTELNPLRNRKKINCLNCDKEFEIHNYETTKYCSSKCYGEHWRKTGLAKEHNAHTITKVDKICKYCGKEYKMHFHRKDTNLYCSIECYNNDRRDFLICPSCGKHFISPKYENRIYCSEICAAKGVNKRQSKFAKFIFNELQKEFKIELEYYIKTDTHKFFCDLKLEKNIIIECYGDYWHANPLIYQKDYYNSKLRKYAHEIWERDKYREHYIADLGYNIIVLWERD